MEFIIDDCLAVGGKRVLATYKATVFPDTYTQLTDDSETHLLDLGLVWQECRDMPLPHKVSILIVEREDD